MTYELVEGIEQGRLGYSDMWPLDEPLLEPQDTQFDPRRGKRKRVPPFALLRARAVHWPSTQDGLGRRSEARLTRTSIVCDCTPRLELFRQGPRDGPEIHSGSSISRPWRATSSTVMSRMQRWRRRGQRRRKQGEHQRSV